MSKRIYQIIALSTLLVAPVVVNIISDVLPGAQKPADAAAPVQPVAPEALPPPPPVSAPPPPPPPMMPSPSEAPALGVSTDPAVDAAPSLDPQGITPEAAADAPPPPPPS